MEVEVRIAVSAVFIESLSCFWVCTSSKFNEYGLKKLFWAIFDEKDYILKLAKFWPKKLILNSQQFFLS